MTALALVARHRHHHARPGHHRHAHSRARVSPALHLRLPGGGVVHDAGHLAGDPLFWLAVAAVVAAVVAVCRAAWWLWRALIPPEGFATAAQIRDDLSARAAGRMLRRTRPGLYRAGKRPGHLPPREYSVPVGRCVSPRMKLRGNPEDSMVIVGMPGSMKSVWLGQLVSPAPGAVICTSSKAKDMAGTVAARAQLGPVHTLNIQRLGGVPSTLRVDLVSGCADPHTAILTGGFLLYGARKHGASSNLDDYFYSNANEVLRCLLHAAALEGLTMVDVHRWALAPEAARQAVDILHRHGAAQNWITTLAGRISVVDKTRDGIFTTLSTALQWMASPEAVATVTPGPGETLNPEVFLRSRGTLYLIGDDDKSGGVAPLFTLIICWLVNEAVRVASLAPGGRLDPWLTLALDEVANIAPVPLDLWMNKCRDHGILPIAAIQSRAQLAARWGEHAAEAIWAAAAYTLILPGSKNVDDAEDLSKLCGTREHTRHELSRGPQGLTRTRRIEERPVLPVHKIRMLGKRRMLVLYRNAAPTIALIRRPWLSPAAWLPRPHRRRRPVTVLHQTSPDTP